jgi:hypothetical protein
MDAQMSLCDVIRGLNPMMAGERRSRPPPSPSRGADPPEGTAKNSPRCSHMPISGRRQK